MISTARLFMTPLDFPRVDFTGSEYINLLLISASFRHQVQGEKYYISKSIPLSVRIRSHKSSL